MKAKKSVKLVAPTAPSTLSEPTIPAGIYNAEVKFCEVKEHKDGIHRAVCTLLEILDGPHQYDPLWKWNNLTTPNAETMLRGEFRAAGVRLGDLADLNLRCDEMHGKRVVIRVAYKDGPYPTITILRLVTQ